MQCNNFISFLFSLTMKLETSLKRHALCFAITKNMLLNSSRYVRYGCCCHAAFMVLAVVQRNHYFANLLDRVQTCFLVPG